MSKRKFAVGQRVWVASEYGRRESVAWTVAGIEGRSYVLTSPYKSGSYTSEQREKVSFKKMEAAEYYMTEDEHGEREWMMKHQWNIRQRVERATPAQLREIAKIVGYEGK